MSADQGGAGTPEVLEGDRPAGPPLLLALPLLAFLVVIGAFAFGTIERYRALEDENHTMSKALSERYGIEIVKTEPLGEPDEPTVWLVDGTKRRCVYTPDPGSLLCSTPEAPLDFVEVAFPNEKASR